MDPNTQNPAQAPAQGHQPDPNVSAVVKAIAMVENGGKIPLDNPSEGQSGEMKSIFQYTPGTWKGYSREILGKDNVPMNVTNESIVTYAKVQKWLKEGYSPEEIASIWNSGKPDSYLQGKSGVNKYGVKYDVPGYVKKFQSFLGKAGNVVGGLKESAPTQAPTPGAGVAFDSPDNPIKQAKRATLPELMNKARLARSAAPARIPGAQAPEVKTI